MSYDFNADEVLQMAEEIERNGAGFYRAAAECADCAGNDVKQLLLDLAAMEDDHTNTFARMRAQLDVADKESSIFDPDDEEAQYLKVMADGKVFNRDPCSLLAGGKSPEEILSIAIGLEKDAIVFYECMKPYVPSEHGKDRLQGIDDIIYQETGHMFLLAEKHRSLTT